MRTLLALAIGTWVGAGLMAAPTRMAAEVRQQAPAADPLAVMEPFVGRDWIAKFPTGGLTDTQHYEWMFGRKFLRNVHHVRDAAGHVVYEGETIYGFDAATAAIRWWYFNATGGYIDGTVVEEADGTLLFEGVNHAGKQQTAKVRSTSCFEEDGFTSTTWFWRDGDWKVERELIFSEKK